MKKLTILSSILFIVSIFALTPQAIANDEIGQEGCSNYEQLQQIANSKGKVRVIVKLEVPGIKELTAESTRFCTKEPGLKETEAASSLGRVNADMALNDAITFVADSVVSGISGTEYHVNYYYRSIPYLALEVSPGSLDILRGLPEVLDIEEDKLITLILPDPEIEKANGTNDLSKPMLNNTVSIIGAENAWGMGYTGSGWYVAVLDTGILSTHEFFKDKIILEACFAQGENGTGDCPNNETSMIGPGAAVPYPGYYSGYGHGTHVAGIAAGNNGSLFGVAKNANIIAVQVFSKVTSSSPPGVGGYESDCLAGLEYIYSIRGSYSIASVNLSLGGGYHSSSCPGDSRNDIIENLRNAKIATVAAMGNQDEGEEICDKIHAPACIPAAVSIGSSNDFDHPSSFSYWHSTLQDLFAPGSVIYSSTAASDSSYESWSGTSMAAPHVAGAWALLRETLPSASVYEIESALKTTGIPITSTCDGYDTPIPRIQVDDAIEELLYQNMVFEITNPSGCDEIWDLGSTLEIQWNYSSGIGKVTLVLLKNCQHECETVGIIARSTENDGSYTWIVGDCGSDLVEPGYHYQIEIYLDDYPSRYDHSDCFFTISEPPPFSLFSPNGGENWGINSSKYIRWNPGLVSGNVRLELWQNGVKLGNIKDTIDNNGEYTWIVGRYDDQTAELDSGYKIKILSVEDESIYDFSNQSFSIYDPDYPVISVTTPNGGEQWEIGDTHAIYWTTENISAGANMNIKLIRNNNKYIGEIFNATPNDGTYNWTITRFTNGDPVEPGDNYYIRVKTIVDSVTIEGFSETFTITGTPLPTIKVTYPYAEKTYYLSSPMPIEWTTVGITGDVSIDLRKSDDSGGYDITSATPYNSSPYNYTVPADVTPGTYFIRIAQGTTIDESGVFTIAEIPAGEMAFTLYPTTVPDAADWTEESNVVGEYDGNKAEGSPGGTTFLTATDFDRWTLPAGKTITKVEYGVLARFTNGANEKARMMEVTHNETQRWLTLGLAWDWKDFDITSLETSWTKAEVDALQVAVRRAYADEPANENLRVGGIRLIVTVDDPSITVTSPNGGETWELGAAHNVTWNAQGLSNNLKITLWRDGSLVGVIGYNIDPALGSYSWTVGQHNGGTASIGAGYKIKIKEISTAVADFSDESFSIVEEEQPEPETFTLYPTTVPNVANWTQESNIIGEYDGNKAEGSTTGTTFLVATNFDNWTLPAGKVITKVEYGILARFTDGVSGKARMMEVTHNETQRWLTFGSAWEWKDFDVTSLEASWTKAEVDALQVAVRRAYTDDPATANLRVGGIRLKVTVE